MRPTLVLLTALLLVVPGCFGPVDENADGGDGTGGGGTGGGMGGGMGGGAGGGGDTLDAGLSCDDLASLYGQALAPARQCAPMLPAVQCTHK